MKYLFLLFLSLGIALSVSAQKSNLDKAKKLIGRTDKIGDARAFLSSAMDSTETRDNIDTYYIAGRIEWEAYDKNRKSNSITPGTVNQIEVARQLLDGYRYFDKAVKMDTAKNSKGQLKPRYTKELKRRLAEKINDFADIASYYYNDPEKKHYSEAHDAFIIYAASPYRKVALPDSIKGKWYFNAGRAAWNGQNFQDAAMAFGEAAKYIENDPMPTVFEIASWRQVALKDTLRENEAKAAILDAAREGYSRFGISNCFILENLVKTLTFSGKGEEAVTFLTEVISEHPDQSVLYGLRAFVFDYLHRDDDSERDYRKYADMHDLSYDIMREAIYKIVNIGNLKWDQIEIEDPDAEAKKADLRKNYFMEAKKMIEKLKGLDDHPGDFTDVLETIYYHIN